MKNPLNVFKEHKVVARLIQVERKLSSRVISFFDRRVKPVIPFRDMEEYYLSIGPVQNAVDNNVLNIVNRDSHYKAANEDDNLDDAVKQMEDWELRFNGDKVRESLVRNWQIFGHHIVSMQDWVPVQMKTIIGKRMDEFGQTEVFIQQIHGQEIPIPAQGFHESPFIDLDRNPWGVGLFTSLMTDFWEDEDGRQGRPVLESFRQIVMDMGRIVHKYASPRTILNIPGVNPEVIDNDIVPLYEKMKPGDRLAMNAGEGAEILEEKIDGNSRFVEYIDKIFKVVDMGLQTSANRVISEPSAMADAREAGSQDDDKVLGIMKKVREFMNNVVIPKVTGLEPGKLVWEWGAKDSFELEFPPSLQLAIDKQVVKPYQAAYMLIKEHKWKIPTDEVIKKEFPELLKQQEEREKELAAQKTNEEKLTNEVKGLIKDLTVANSHA